MFSTVTRCCVPLITLLLSACSLMEGEDYVPAIMDEQAQYKQWQHDQNQIEAAIDVNQITDLIAVPKLLTLVEQALQANPSLQQTALALEIAKVQRNITSGDRLPNASAGFNASKNEGMEDVSYNADVSVSWELDLWHKLSDSTLAADMDVASSRVDFQSAKDVLAATIMRTWLLLSWQQQQVIIEQKKLQLIQNNEKITLKRYRTGLGDLADLDTSRSNTASILATIVNHKENIARTQRNLSQLIGANYQETNFDVADEFPEVWVPLAQLPEQSLARRPDLQKAYYAIEGAQYRVKVAYKSLLPSISLSGSLSDVGSTPSDALLTSPVWGLLSQLTMPLFQGGKLHAQIDVANLRAEQSYWAYKDVLLNAVVEVENNLAQEKSLTQRLTHINEALTISRRSADHYQEKYRQGLVDIIELLQTQKQTFDLEIQLGQIRYDRLINRIDLGLALGLGLKDQAQTDSQESSPITASKRASL